MGIKRLATAPSEAAREPDLVDGYSSGSRIKVERRAELAPLTTRQVARLLGCGVKTVHNWVADGRIPHFRTPGRHLRFRAQDVAEFMRRSGFPVPGELGSRCPLLIVADGAALEALTLPQGTTVVDNPFDALVVCASEQPLLVVVAAQAMRSMDATAFRAALDRACGDCRAIWLGSPPPCEAGLYELRPALSAEVLAQLLRVPRRDRPLP